MRKNIILIVISVIVLVFSGCTTLDNNVPVQAIKERDSIIAEQNRLLRELNDEELWCSARRVSQNLATCLDEHRLFEVNLLCKLTDENGEFEYREIDFVGGEWEFRFIGEFYQTFFGDALVCAIASDETVRRYHDDGYKIEIVGGAISWARDSFRYALCDGNGDGVWDFVSDGYISFVRESDNDPDFVFVDGCEIWIKSYGSHLVECDGDETISTVERSFRSKTTRT